MRTRPRSLRPALAVVATLALVLGTWTAATAAGGDKDPNPPLPGASSAPKAPRIAVTPSKTEEYTGIKPCRVLDTRTSTPLADAGRNFRVSGVLSGQGGLNTCGIPINATSIVINLTGISTGSTGFIRGWAYKGASPTATLLNFGPGINVSNQVNIPLCRTSCGGYGFTLRAWGSTDIVGDAVGYYTAPAYAFITANGAVFNDISSGLLSSTRTGTGTYTLTFDRAIDHCAVSGTDEIYAFNRDVSPDAWDGGAGGILHVVITDKSDAAVDSYFYVSVTC